MSDLISRITNAIFRQEGESSTMPNPGNLRDAPWFPKGLQGRRYYPVDPNTANIVPEFLKYSSSGGFWVPRSRAEGIAGAAHVVALHIAKGESLRELISSWAPPSENQTEIYIKNVAAWAGIPNTNLPLWCYIENDGPSQTS